MVFSEAQKLPTGFSVNPVAVKWRAASPEGRRLWPAHGRKRRKKPRFDPQGAISPAEKRERWRNMCGFDIHCAAEQEAEVNGMENHLLIIWDNGPIKGITCIL